MSSFPDRYDTLREQDRASVSRSFSADDIRQWSTLAGLQQSWEGVPEPLIAGLFSYLLGEELPGHGTNYLKQHMHFEGVARAGETLTATVTITRLRADKALVYLDTRCVGEDRRVICSGDALVLFQR